MSGTSTFGVTRVRTAEGGSSAWSASIASRILRWAAWCGPGSIRERLAEEWSAHLAELPGTAARLRFVLGCFWAATVIASGGEQAASVPAAGSSVQRSAMTGGRPGRPASFVRRAAVADISVMSEINTTPLIDVMLVLLVTLIVSLPTLTHAVKLDLPRAAPSSTAVPTVIDLDIDSDGSIGWNGTAVAGLQQLDDYLRAQARVDSQAEIHLRPERRARYDLVAKVLALAQQDHMDKVAFVNTAEFEN